MQLSVTMSDSHRQAGFISFVVLQLFVLLYVYPFNALAVEEVMPLAQPDSVISTPLNTLTFVSCSKEYNNVSDIWQAIRSHPSDAFVWMGDAIYPKASDPSVIKRSYEVMQQSEAYQEVQKKFSFLDGTWDDHDYGLNDGGRFFKHKAASQQLFLDFLNISKTSPRRKREGVYSSHLFGASLSPHQRAKVILLDTRYHRDEPYFTNLSYYSGSRIFIVINSLFRFLTTFLSIGTHHNGDVLGNEQWLWLQAQLSNSDAAAHIIVSSIQVLTGLSISENWNHFPESKKRLIRLLKKTKPRGLILLSGDVHFAEILGEEEGLLEITSSGLTHSIVEDFYFYPLFKLLLPFFGKQRRRLNDYYFGRNFGILDLHYNKEGMILKGSVYSNDNEEVNSFTQTFSSNEDTDVRFSQLDKPHFSRLILSPFQIVLRFCFILLVAGWILQIVLIIVFKFIRLCTHNAKDRKIL
ncbi:phosphodiesterase/alkaline phosphatase D family protein [Cardiosporidium cionae]|uniref:Phosphodiesterase/alkaline phosphatase D family protein n=1 Tax=Cardiosporidium cionae TaxID=476202 RepID=A0ABQ7J510_9APIC|nr:phosphodiesterase/alkaline phosphatase D family protein [Cardiosporidium cionae]|eukprot:KAF8818760.1 phosphodiesterase/alkaline phosphatase D family protein [Cardiosporidium cionae]